MAEQNSCWTKSKVAETARDGAQWLPQRCLNTQRCRPARSRKEESRGAQLREVKRPAGGR